MTQDYSFTRHRIFQWLGILLSLGLIAVGYWYWRAEAGYKTNVSPTGALTSGLVGYWTFDGADVSGTTATDRSGGNNGTLIDNPIKVIGKIGQALEFAFNYVELGSSVKIDNSSQGTLSAWVYYTSDPSASGLPTLFSYGGGTATNAGTFKLQIRTSGGNKLSIAQRSNGDVTLDRITGSTILSTNRWYHVAAVSNGTSYALYVDGSPEQLTVNSGSNAGDWFADTTVSETDKSVLGVDYVNNSFDANFGGRIDEFRAYNRALTASEIQAQYKAGQSDEVNSGASQAQGGSRLDSGLAGYWALDNGSGTSATDASTNGNTGTLTNGPTWTTGQIGGAVTFDGVDDYITISSSSQIAGGRPMTAAAWVKRDALGEGDQIFIKRGGTNDGWGLSIGSDNKVAMTFFGIADRYSVQTITDTNWHHVAATVGPDGSLMFYIDGTAVGSTGNFSSPPTGTSAPLYLGAFVSNVGTLEGYGDFSLDETRIYNRALSADEVAELYRLNTPTGTDTSLDGYWSFNGKDVSGTTAYDRSGSGNNGTLTNGPTITPGKVGQALNFDGTNDSVVLNTSTVLKPALFTVSTWAYADTGSASYRGIYLPSYADGYNSGFLLYINNDGHAAVRYGNGSAPVGNITSGESVLGGWHHLVTTFDGTMLTLFVDGVEKASTTASTLAYTGSSTTAQIGAGNGTDTFDGKLDEFRLYGRAFTEAEIVAQYTAGRSDEVNSGASQAQGGSRLDSGLAGYWKLDDGSGTSATDSSTNGNTGTLTNGPSWTTGQIGGAVDFDGANDVITTSTVVPSTGTVSVWVNTTASINSGQEYTALYATTSGSSFSLSFAGYSSFNEWRLTYRGNYGSTVSVNGPAYTSNAHQGWHLLTATWDVTKGGTLFLDGVAISSGTSTTNAFSSMSLGFSTNSLADWVGKLDEVRLYNRILSADEVAQLYRLNSPTSVDTGLKGYWSFNGPDVSGTTAYDRSGSSNNGTLTNGPTVTPGKVSQALNFSTNDYVAMGSAPVTAAPLTITAWIKPAASSSGVAVALLKDSSTWNGFYFGFFSGQIGCSSASANVFTASNIAGTVGEWQFVSCVMNSTTSRTAYVNGVAGTTDTTSSSPAVTPDKITIGAARHGSLDNYFNGAIDEVRVYNRALTTDEISSLYNSGK